MLMPGLPLRPSPATPRLPSRLWVSVAVTLLQCFMKRTKNNGALDEFAFAFHHKTLFPLHVWLFHILAFPHSWIVAPHLAQEGNCEESWSLLGSRVCCLSIRLLPSSDYFLHQTTSFLRLLPSSLQPVHLVTRSFALSRTVRQIPVKALTGSYV